MCVNKVMVWYLVAFGWMWFADGLNAMNGNDPFERKSSSAWQRDMRKNKEYVREQLNARSKTTMPKKTLFSQPLFSSSPWHVPQVYSVEEFERLHLKRLAQAAMLAYDPVPESLDAYGWVLQPGDAYVQDDLHAYVFTMPGGMSQRPLAVVSIRGTVEAKTWLLNLAEVGVRGSEANRRLVDGLASVTGIDLASATQRIDLHARDRMHTLLRWISGRKKVYQRTHELLVSGHSLGGFLAAVVAVELGVSGAGFCAPALGEYDRYTDVPELTQHSVKKFKERGHCFVEWIVKGDIVPHANLSKHLATMVHGAKYPYVCDRGATGPADAHSMARLARHITDNF